MGTHDDTAVTALQSQAPTSTRQEPAAMYLPRHFEQPDPGALHILMRAHPLVRRVVTTADGPTADLLTLELDISAPAAPVLRGHVARANPLWLRALVGIEIPVTALAGQWKVCQNRDAAAREGAAAGLCAGAAASHAPLAAALAAEMTTAVRRGG